MGSSYYYPFHQAFTDKKNFGQQRTGYKHQGTDMTCSNKTAPIYSIGTGTVIHKRWGSETAGNYVTIKHSKTLYYTYMHLSKISVNQGQTVTCKTCIGNMGNTGRSTGAHLHLQMGQTYSSGAAKAPLINPTTWLASNAAKSLDEAIGNINQAGSSGISENASKVSTSTVTIGSINANELTGFLNKYRTYMQQKCPEAIKLLQDSVFKTITITEDNNSSSSGETSSTPTTKLTGTPGKIVDYLMGKGLNKAAAIGIIANIRAESNFNLAAVGDHGTSFGLCQWHNNRGSAMKKVAGSNWKNNLTGQLDYLWQELNGGYKSKVLNPLKNVPNTLAGAKQAADIFVRKFEVPANVNSQSTKRQNYAAEYWSKAGG